MNHHANGNGHTLSGNGAGRPKFLGPLLESDKSTDEEALLRAHTRLDFSIAAIGAQAQKVIDSIKDLSHEPVHAAASSLVNLITRYGNGECPTEETLQQIDYFCGELQRLHNGAIDRGDRTITATLSAMNKSLVETKKAYKVFNEMANRTFYRDVGTGITNGIHR